MGALVHSLDDEPISCYAPAFHHLGILQAQAARVQAVPEAAAGGAHHGEGTRKEAQHTRGFQVAQATGEVGRWSKIPPLSKENQPSPASTPLSSINGKPSLCSSLLSLPEHGCSIVSGMGLRIVVCSSLPTESSPCSPCKPSIFSPHVPSLWYIPCSPVA